jgi:hypothetical protein
VRFHDRFGDGEAKSGTTVRGGAHGIGSIESLKNVAEMFRGYARTGIGDGEGRVPVFATGAGSPRVSAPQFHEKATFKAC